MPGRVITRAMRAFTIAVCLLAATPALAAEIFPATGTVLPPQPSLFVAGTPDLVLNVTSNDRLVPYTVVPTDIANLVRVDIALEAGPLRIGHDLRGTLGEYVIAEAMPHRLRFESIHEIATDAALVRLEWPDGTITAVASDVVPLPAGAVRASVLWSDRSERALFDRSQPVLGCRGQIPIARPSASSRGIVLALLAAIAGLALALQRRVSRDSSVA